MGVVEFEVGFGSKYDKKFGSELQDSPLRFGM